jgi:TorA maturation chaperone TorD
MVSAAVDSSTAPQEEVAAEERARADVYALLAALFYSPPSDDLLKRIAAAHMVDEEASQTEFGQAWHALQSAARAAAPEAVRNEYDSAFITAGRPPVFLYGSVYQTGFLMDKPLARLRDDLAHIGLARRADVGEPEDHISALCDVMRFLITGADGVPPATLDAQREFFEHHIASWYARLCDAIETAEQTSFYRSVAAFAREFFDLEVRSFEIA